MAASPDFLATLADIVAPLGSITTRRMFSGAAIYCDGQVFALVLDDVLYLKSDDTSAADFAREGCDPFTYDTKDGRRVLTSYRRAPDRLLDEPDDLVEWARTALSVARRAAAAKTRKLRSKTAPKAQTKRLKR